LYLCGAIAKGFATEKNFRTRALASPGEKEASKEYYSLAARSLYHAPAVSRSFVQDPDRLGAARSFSRLENLANQFGATSKTASSN